MLWVDGWLFGGRENRSSQSSLHNPPGMQLPDWRRSRIAEKPCVKTLLALTTGRIPKTKPCIPVWRTAWIRSWYLLVNASIHQTVHHSITGKIQIRRTTWLINWSYSYHTNWMASHSITELIIRIHNYGIYWLTRYVSNGVAASVHTVHNAWECKVLKTTAQSGTCTVLKRTAQYCRMPKNLRRTEQHGTILYDTERYWTILNGLVLSGWVLGCIKVILSRSPNCPSAIPNCILTAFPWPLAICLAMDWKRLGPANIDHEDESSVESWSYRRRRRRKLLYNFNCIEPWRIRARLLKAPRKVNKQR